MSAEEANIEILDIADASKDLNVPFEKMISTVSSLAKEFRKMKRIWVGKGLDGLLERREAEAKLIESCI
jgi:hypothetical protein